MSKINIEASFTGSNHAKQSLPTEVSPDIDRSKCMETLSANIPYQSKSRRGIVGNLNPLLQTNQNILNLLECENVTNEDYDHHSGESCLLFNLLEVSNEQVVYEKSASLYLRNQSVSH